MFVTKGAAFDNRLYAVAMENSYHHNHMILRRLIRILLIIIIHNIAQFAFFYEAKITCFRIKITFRIKTIFY